MTTALCSRSFSRLRRIPSPHRDSCRRMATRRTVSHCSYNEIRLTAAARPLPASSVGLIPEVTVTLGKRTTAAAVHSSCHPLTARACPGTTTGNSTSGGAASRSCPAGLWRRRVSRAGGLSTLLRQPILVWRVLPLLRIRLPVRLLGWIRVLWVSVLRVPVLRLSVRLRLRHQRIATSAGESA